MNRKVRVRFAPSPTGPLHIGGVRTALYNYLFARKHGGDFILRIEDTDQTRFVPGTEEYIIKSLDWCGITCDEGIHINGKYGPYRQSERKNIYSQYAEQLVKDGKAYYAFDTPGDLEAMRERLKAQGVPSPKYNSVTREYMKNSLSLSEDEVKSRLAKGEPYVIRINIPRSEEVRIDDRIRGWVVFSSSQLDDKVIFKSDGFPTYHLANVVDDYLMKISHVIRGEEWLPSTPIHVLLYRYLGWEKEMPEFAHLPLILRPDGNGKLSKRDGDRLGFPVYPLEWTDPKSGEKVSGFREKGFFPEAFINMLALLGWNPGTERELFNMKELINVFSMDKVGKSGAKFDYEKAKWFNQQYIKASDDKILAEEFKSVLEEKGIEYDEKYVTAVSGSLKERLTFTSDFWEQGNYFFIQPETYDEPFIKKKWKPENKPVFEAIIEKLNDLSDFSFERTEEIIKEVINEKQVHIGEILPVLRVMLSGIKTGPPVFEIAALLGKDETIKRIRQALKAFEKYD